MADSSSGTHQLGSMLLRHSPWVYFIHLYFKMVFTTSGGFFNMLGSSGQMSYKSLLLKANSGTGPLFSRESCAIDFWPRHNFCRLGKIPVNKSLKIKLVHIISLFERETIPQICVYICTYMYMYVYVCIIYIYHNILYNYIHIKSYKYTDQRILSNFHPNMMTHLIHDPRLRASGRTQRITRPWLRAVLWDFSCKNQWNRRVDSCTLPQSLGWIVAIVSFTDVILVHPILRTTHVQIILKRLPTKGKSRPACKFKSCALHLHFPLINYNTTHCWTTHCAQYHDRPTILHQWEMPALLTRDTSTSPQPRQPHLHHLSKD